MTNAIYLTTTEPFSGKSIIALGLMNLLAGKTEKLAYFKPVVSTQRTQTDTHLDTIAKHFDLKTPYNEMFAFTRDEVVKYQNAGKEAYIIDTVIEKFKKLPIFTRRFATNVTLGENLTATKFSPRIYSMNKWARRTSMAQEASQALKFAEGILKINLISELIV